MLSLDTQHILTQGTRTNVRAACRDLMEARRETARRALPFVGRLRADIATSPLHNRTDAARRTGHGVDGMVEPTRSRGDQHFRVDAAESLGVRVFDFGDARIQNLSPILSAGDAIDQAQHATDAAYLAGRRHGHARRIHDASLHLLLVSIRKIDGNRCENPAYQRTQTHHHN